MTGQLVFRMQFAIHDYDRCLIRIHILHMYTIVQRRIQDCRTGRPPINIIPRSQEFYSALTPLPHFQIPGSAIGIHGYFHVKGLFNRPVLLDKGFK